MAEHIQGPWGIVEERYTNQNITIETDAWIIAEVWSLNEGMGRETMANARLIAAAPDLLKACLEAYDALKDIVNAANNGMPYTPTELEGLFMKDINNIWEVIIKAGGEQ